MPHNYIDGHETAVYWDRDNLREYLKGLMADRKASYKYDSIRPDFLKAGQEVSRFQLRL